MAAIKLGLLGSEVTLPEIKYAPGSGIDLPFNCAKNVDEVSMLDGSSNFNIMANHPRSFPLEWDELTWAEVVTILDVCVLEQELSFINEYVDSVAYPVVVLDYGFTPIAETTGQTTILYRFRLELKGTGVV